MFWAWIQRSSRSDLRKLMNGDANVSRSKHECQDKRIWSIASYSADCLPSVAFLCLRTWIRASELCSDFATYSSYAKAGRAIGAEAEPAGCSIASPCFGK